MPVQAGRLPGSNKIGAEQNPAIIAQFGGLVGNQKLAGHVDRIGCNLIALTEESNDRWTFTILNSPVVNAFALPGGYVYVTRGLLAIANNEAELAGVLGHEILHVTMHHGEDCIRRNNRAGIGVVIGGKDGASDAVQLGVRLAGGCLARHS